MLEGSEGLKHEGFNKLSPEVLSHGVAKEAGADDGMSVV